MKAINIVILALIVSGIQGLHMLKKGEITVDKNQELRYNRQQ